jgi:hypothetical protein
MVVIVLYALWGNHCHAMDKDAKWKRLMQTSKKIKARQILNEEKPSI